MGFSNLEKLVNIFENFSKIFVLNIEYKTNFVSFSIYLLYNLILCLNPGKFKKTPHFVLTKHGVFREGVIKKTSLIVVVSYYIITM